MFNVLIVEDNEATTILLRNLLKRRFQCDISNVHDGIEALKSISAKKPDLILLDYLMPRMDGYEFLKWIKSDKKYFNIPVIMVSAVNDKLSIQKVINLGVNDYILKPLDLNLIIEKIANTMTDRNKNLSRTVERLERKVESLEKENEKLKKTNLDLESHKFKIFLN